MRSSNFVFKRGHDITDEEIRKSRGYRREALKNAQALQKQGFMRMKDLDPLHYVIRRAAMEMWPKDCITTGDTDYQARGYYGRPELRRETWIKCPIEGVMPWQVMKVAEINYKARPQYRDTWEVKLALEMQPEEIEVFLMMDAIGV